MPLDVGWIKERIAILQRYDYMCKNVFGAVEHRNRPNPPLTEEQVKSFEEKHGISLPEDYRTFLLEIGNGGVGPGYGLFKLEDWDWESWLSEYPEPDKFLSTPFPYTKVWDPLKDADPTEEWRVRALSNIPEGTPIVERNRLIEVAINKAFDELVEVGFRDAKHVTGTMVICHLGCAITQSLVVSGSMKGTVWMDGRGLDDRIYPVVSDFNDPDSKPLTFSEWYCQWLNDASEKVVLGNWMDVDRHRRMVSTKKEPLAEDPNTALAYDLSGFPPPKPEKPKRIGIFGYLISLFR